MNMMRVFLAVAAIAALAGLGRAAYLEGDYSGQTEPPPTVIAPPRPEPPQNPLERMVRRASVREGYHYRGLTVFLVELPEIGLPDAYLTTQEALEAGVLTAYEKLRAEVPVLIVENRGNQAVLMLGGEMLHGGRQNRTLSQDVLLPARSGQVEVPVLCIEQGRWSAGEEGFQSGSSAAALGVRSSVLAGAPQEEVWGEVERYGQSLGVDSSTQDLKAIQESPELKAELSDFRAHFERHCWRPEAVGMVVARRDRIVGADLFANPELFRKHRERLLDSYAADCIAQGETRERRIMPPPVRNEAERFLRRVLAAEFTWQSTPGMGRLLEVRGADIRGSALNLNDEVVHAALFPQPEVIVSPPPRPTPPPRPMPLPEPRSMPQQMPREDLSLWSDEGQITISNPGQPREDYPVRVVLPSMRGMQPDFADLRFANANGNPLSYWIETSDVETAVVWVKVPLMEPGETRITLRYGNPSARSGSDGDATFIVFDDFERGFDEEKWKRSRDASTGGYGAFVKDGILHVYGGDMNHLGWVRPCAELPPAVTFEARMLAQPHSDRCCCGVRFTNADFKRLLGAAELDYYFGSTSTIPALIENKDSFLPRPGKPGVKLAGYWKDIWFRLRLSYDCRAGGENLIMGRDRGEGEEKISCEARRHNGGLGFEIRPWSGSGGPDHRFLIDWLLVRPYAPGPLYITVWPGIGALPYNSVMDDGPTGTDLAG